MAAIKATIRNVTAQPIMTVPFQRQRLEYRVPK
jgi:hypothetical protein